MYNSHVRFFVVGQAMLCRERQPLWKSDDGLNLTCWINPMVTMVFLPLAQAPPQADATELLCRLQGQLLHPDFQEKQE